MARAANSVFTRPLVGRVGALSAFTRVHSPSKTGVNALKDALWRRGGGRAVTYDSRLTRTTPSPSPQGGGEQTECVAPLCVKSNGTRSNG